MPGCLSLIAAIIMQKFPGSVKLTCPENQSLIMRRLENWKHKALAATGYIYNLYHYICWCKAFNTLDLMWVLRSLYEVYHSQYRSHLIVMIVNCAVRQMVTLRYIYKHIQVTNTLSALNVG